MAAKKFGTSVLEKDKKNVDWSLVAKHIFIYIFAGHQCDFGQDQT